jgi:RimJ/RimL family protein N-acetyltransferase
MQNIRMLIRKATEEDYRIVFEWRNDQLSREMFFGTAPISLDAHRSWFVGVLKDKMRQIYIGEIDKKPVGIARFDLRKGKKEAEVSITISPSMRGKGLGKELLISSIDDIETQFEIQLFARVKNINIASKSIFERAGFQIYKEADNVIYLSRPITEVKFKKVGPNDIDSLYGLLKKRVFSISHDLMPSKEKHKKFVKRAPYKHWYLIYKNEELCGSFYIKRDNSVGLNLVRQRLPIIEETIRFIKSSFLPEKSIPSEIPPHFYLNVAYPNKRLSEMLIKLGYNPIQTSYKL